MSMGARQAGCAIVRRCAMYGIELKVYTSFAYERSSSCIVCMCELDKGSFIYGRYASV